MNLPHSHDQRTPSDVTHSPQLTPISSAWAQFSMGAVASRPELDEDTAQAEEARAADTERHARGSRGR